MEQLPDYYAQLGVSREASAEEIRRAYHRAARELHPDLNEDVNANDSFLQLQAAYEVLSDPDKRTEYDQSLPPLEEKTPAVGLNVLFSRPSLIKISEPQMIFVMMELTAPPAAKAEPSPPLNVCLVLDRSTSMRGERMDTVKRTAIKLLRQLSQEDIISIVTFSDRAEVLVSGGKLSNRIEIENKIKMIQPSGGTEIYHGLDAGFFEVRSRSRNNSTNHIILLTDGRTYGDEAECLRIADQAAYSGIGISGLGIGSEWNDVFIDSIAARTGGSSLYISNPSEIEKALNEVISGLRQIYAERVSFEFVAQPGVEMHYAFRLSPQANPLKTSSPIRLGRIPMEADLTFLLEFIVDPIDKTSDALTLIEGQISMDIPTRANTEHTIPLHLSGVISQESSTEPPPTQLLKAVSQLTLYRMQERANQYLAEGQTDDASRFMKNLATHLFSQDQHDLARAALAEANNILHKQRLSETGKKRIKYGTRALLLPSGYTGQIDSPPGKGNSP